MCRVESGPKAVSQAHWLVPKLMPWNTPFRKPPELPGGTGLSNVTVVVAPLTEMVKVWAFEVPPPGVGVNAVTEAVPPVAMSEAGMAAVSWPAETRVVGRLAPFQRTTEPLTKFVPLTVRVNAGPPAVADIGFRLVVVGVGLPPWARLTQ